MMKKNKILEWLKLRQKKESSSPTIVNQDTTSYPNLENKSIPDTTYSNSKVSKKTMKQEKIKPIFIKEEKKEREEEPIIPEIAKENITVDELAIKNDTLQEFEKMLRSDRYEMERISYELNTIKKEEQEENTSQEIEKLIERLNNLIQRFEKLKKDFYTKYYDEINIDTNNDSYIKHLIDEYKIAIKNDHIKNAAILEIKQMEEYIDLMNEIIEIENQSSKINNSLEDKKKELTDVDNEIDTFDESYKEIDKVNDYINRFAIEQGHILSSLEKKIEDQEITSKAVEYQQELVTDYTKLLASILLLASASTIPPTKNGNALKIVLMTGAITGILTSRKRVMKEKKTVTKTTYIDYEKEILNSISHVNDLSTIVNQSLLDIKQLKKEFEHDFGEYANSIPSFYDMLIKLDSIEKDLEVKNQLIKDFDKRLDKAKKKNNSKVKKIEVDYPK